MDDERASITPPKTGSLAESRGGRGALQPVKKADREVPLERLEKKM